MKKSAAALAIAVAIGLTACGGGTTTVLQSTPAPAPTTPTADINQRTADWFARIAPSELAQVCRLKPQVGEAQTHQFGVKYLGDVIIQRGADVDATVDALLARC